MADFKSRLIIENSDYIKGLKDAKKALYGFGAENKKMSHITKGAAATTGKFSSIIGVAGKLISKYSGYITAGLSAGYAFNEMMKNSQAFGDKMTIAMNSTKSAVNELFYAMGTFDFSSFTNGFDDIIKKSAQAEALLDQLGNTKISYSFVRAENNRELASSKAIANNKDLDKATREEGFKNWRTALDKSYEYAHNLEGDTHAAIIALSEKNTALKSVTIDDVKAMMRLDIKNPEVRSLEKDALGSQYEEYQSELGKLKRGPKTSVWNDKGLRSYSQQLDDLAEKYLQAILYNNLLNRKNDEAWTNIVNMMIEADNATEELGSKTEELNNAYREFQTSLKTKEVNPTKKYTPKGSLAEIDSQIRDASKLYAEATSDAARTAAMKTLNYLRKYKTGLEFIASHPNDPGKVERRKVSLAPLAKKPDMSGTLEQIDMKPQVKDALDYASAIQSCSTALTSFGSLFGGQAGEALSYFSNLIGGSLQAAAAIQALIPVKQEEANMNMKTAASGAAASVSSIPFAGPALAIAAVASIIAALTAIPSFAEGGIVPGSNFRDGIRANVSSGEMFINQHDQSKLFKAIKSGNFGGSGSQPYLEGETIYVGLRNYMTRTGKTQILG